MKATRTYRRNTSNNNDDGDKFGNSRQQLHRRCKDSHPYYGIDIVNEDEDYDPSKKKKRAPGSSSSSKQAQLRDPRRKSSLVTEKQEEKSSSTEITLFTWLIDMEIVRENCAVYCYFWPNKMVIGRGKITRLGIDCGCCNGLFSVPNFLRHRKVWYDNPLENIVVGDGYVSMLTCLIEAWNRHSIAARSGYQHVEKRFKVQDDYDDCCMICADGGDLICCERCPSTYHTDCIGLFKGVPKEAWHCSYCRCKHCDLDNSSHFLLTCFQCSKKSHTHCSGFIGDQLRMGLLPPKIPFCGNRCWMVYQKFEEKLGKTMTVGLGLSWMIVRRMGLDSAGKNSEDLHLKATCNTMIVLAAKLMNESFNCIVDRQTRSNMIETVVYNCGSNFTRTNFSRFYTVILELHGQIISVASLRMPSPDIAEIPFIATLEKWQRRGMCRLLLLLIESELADMGAKHIIIPSAEDMVESWQEKFGFTLLDEAMKKEVAKLNILTFPKTTRLQKQVKMQYNEVEAQLNEIKARVEENNAQAENTTVQQEEAKVQTKEPSKVQQEEVPRRTKVLDLNMPPE